LVWELEAEDSLGEDEELSSSLSLFICRVDKRGSFLVLSVRVNAAGFEGRLLVDVTVGVAEEDDVLGDFTGFMMASFIEDWF
jgi:hypothetical protein